MRLVFTVRAEDDYDNLSSKLKVRADRQLDKLAQDLHYPSLHAKKYDESQGVWQARLSRDWRVYFIIESDAYVLLSIRKHP